MAKWIKPNGKEVEIHENSIEYVKSIGWKPAKKRGPKKDKAKKE